MHPQQIEIVRRASTQNPALKDMLTIFRGHEREYFSTTLRGMRNAMVKLGKKHSHMSIREALKTLSEAGVGTLKKGNRPEDISLEQMKLSTMELGALVAGDSKNMRRFLLNKNERNVEGMAETVKSAASSLKVYPMRKASNISITVTINGKPVIMPLPDDLSPDQLQTLIQRLKELEDGYGK